MSDQQNNLVKFLEDLQQEIEEYVEYLVDVEGVELSDYQQKKLVEPISFQILKIRTDITSQRLAPTQSADRGKHE